MRRRHIRIAVAAALALMLLAAACGGDDEETSAGTTAPGDTEVTEPDETEEAEETEETTEPDDGAAAAVLALEETDLGEILVDGEGRTVYLFTNDSGGQSSCVDACADNWPPVEAPADPTVGEGLDQSLVGSITRPDGTSQLTYGDAPLYLYAADRAAGDTNGQGVGDVWFVVGADGEAIRPNGAEASY